jgi:hypothetical protein
MTKDEGLRPALEGAANYIDALGGDSRKYRQALANAALDKMAENARELGLDYEPVWCGHCNGSGRMVRDPDIGTDQECFVCDGAGVPAAPVQEDWGPGPHECHSLTASVQEPVAWINAEKRTFEWNGPVLWNTPTVAVLEKIPLYTTPPAAQRQWVGLTKTVVGNHLRRHALGDQSTFRQGFKEGVAFAELKLKEKNK